MCVHICTVKVTEYFSEPIRQKKKGLRKSGSDKRAKQEEEEALLPVPTLDGCPRQEKLS